MKKIIALLLSSLIVICLCSCAASNEVIITTYTVNKEGVNYVVDPGEPTTGSIFDGVYTYQYEISGSTAEYLVRITYPDNSTYWQNTRMHYSGIVARGSGWSDDYDKNRYADGQMLCEILEKLIPKANQTS